MPRESTEIRGSFYHSQNATIGMKIYYSQPFLPSALHSGFSDVLEPPPLRHRAETMDHNLAHHSHANGRHDFSGIAAWLCLEVDIPHGPVDHLKTQWVCSDGLSDRDCRTDCQHGIAGDHCGPNPQLSPHATGRLGHPNLILSAKDKSRVARHGDQARSHCIDPQGLRQLAGPL